MNAGEREGLRERAHAFLVQCGSCDAGLPMGCACHDGDPRPVIAALLDALEAAERKVARCQAILDAWDAWDGSLGPDGQTHPDSSSPRDRDRLRAALAAEDTAELPPRTHGNGPRSYSGPESGQLDHRDDEGRSGAQDGSGL